MTIAMKLIKPAFAALLMTGAAWIASPASATLVCPGGYTDPNRGPGDFEYCPQTPTPQPGGDVTNTTSNTNTNVAGAVAGAAAGAVSGSSSKATAKGGRGGNASSVSHGGAGGNAKATGGKAVAHGGRQRQSQSARTGNISNVGNTNVETAAASVGGGSYMGECPAGGFEMGVQTIGVGIFAKRCKADFFPYMRQAGGDRIALAHLGNVHGPANKALRANGLAETTKERDARQTREARAKMMFKTYQPRPDNTQLTVGFTISYCTVIERHWNGVPSNIFAVPPSSLPICAKYHGLIEAW